MSRKKMDSNARNCYGVAISIALVIITTIMEPSWQKDFDLFRYVSFVVIGISFIFIILSLAINKSDCYQVTQSNLIPIYDNNTLMELLGITEEDLKHLRDNDLLGYSRYGDKYWYTQADVDRFLSRCHYTPFGK